MLARSITSGVRFAQSNGRMLSAISFAEFGVPQQVLKIGNAIEATEATDGLVCVAVKASRVSAEDIRAISGRSLVNTSRGVAGTTAVGSVVSSGVVSVPKGASVFVVGSGTWNDHVTVAGENVFALPAQLSAEAAAQVDVVASALMIFQQNAIAAGDSIVVDVADEALSSAIFAVAKNNSVNVSKSGDKSDGVKLVVTSSSGAAVSALAKQLAPGGTIVRVNASTTSSAGVTSGVGAFIFQDKRIRGFDFYAQARSNPAACAEAVAAAAALLVDGKVTVSAAKTFAQKDYIASIDAVHSGKSAVLSISK